MNQLEDSSREIEPLFRAARSASRPPPPPPATPARCSDEGEIPHPGPVFFPSTFVLDISCTFDDRFTQSGDLRPGEGSGHLGTGPRSARYRPSLPHIAIALAAVLAFALNYLALQSRDATTLVAIADSSIAGYSPDPGFDTARAPPG